MPACSGGAVQEQSETENGAQAPLVCLQKLCARTHLPCSLRR